MKYNNLLVLQGNRIWDVFVSHHMYINEKYNAFSRMYVKSDRDRFVKKFFGHLVGKYFAIIDKTYYGHVNSDGTGFCSHNPISVYSVEYHDQRLGSGLYHEVKKPYKKFIKVTNVEAVNTLCGTGYIAIHSIDYIGRPETYVLDSHTLHCIQWREINQIQFDDISAAFSDDRDAEEYSCEVKSLVGETIDPDDRRRRIKSHIETTSVTVCAIDRESACEKIRENCGPAGVITSGVEKVVH